MQYSVKLHAFEGPLDLLLHLIQKNDLDLYDIPVKDITDQYMVYIHAMQVLHLDIASEYLVMASTLLHMKSQLLLPVEEDDYGDEEFAVYEDDTREDLMQRLIEYKKYKEAAHELKTREIARSDQFSKPMTDLTPLLGDEECDLPNINVSVYDMLQAFQKIKKRKKRSRPAFSTIHKEEIPIEKMMSTVMMKIHNSGGRSKFSDLFETENDSHFVVTFLALLELMKSRTVMCEQEKNFDDIYIYRKEVSA